MREVGVIVGIDFGGPQRARDQRRKIVAIAAHATAWRSYRIDATKFGFQACKKP